MMRASEKGMNQVAVVSLLRVPAEPPGFGGPEMVV
jgi:hypothetical protein